jgi:hypothetical protein
MDVFRIEFEEVCRWIAPRDESFFTTINHRRFDGSPKIEKWGTSLECEYLDESIPLTNFQYLIAGTLVVDRVALNALQDYTGTCELLPCHVTDAKYWALNLIEPILDCIDESNTVWRVAPSGRKLSVLEYSFRPDVLDNCKTLFKSEHSKRSELLVADSGDEESFFSVYKAAGLTGLTFKHLWRSKD